MYYNKEFVYQVGKKDYHYIRMHGQQNVKKTLYISETNCFLLQEDSVILKQTSGQNSHAKTKTSTSKNINTKYAKPKAF